MRNVTVISILVIIFAFYPILEPLWAEAKSVRSIAHGHTYKREIFLFLIRA